MRGTRQTRDPILFLGRWNTEIEIPQMYPIKCVEVISTVSITDFMTTAAFCKYFLILDKGAIRFYT